MILLFTGNGKGKTTASLGQMVLVLGRGRKALMIQFIKGPWESGEDRFFEKIKNQRSKMKDEKLIHGLEGLYASEIKKMGLGFVGILGDKLPRQDHIQAAENALAFFEKERATGDWHLIVLDEINVAVSLGLLSPARVLAAIQDYPKEKILLLTGRDAPKEFIEIADLATEMREIKHPFNDKKLAKITIEF